MLISSVDITPLRMVRLPPILLNFSSELIRSEKSSDNLSNIVPRLNILIILLVWLCMSSNEPLPISIVSSPRVLRVAKSAGVPGHDMTVFNIGGGVIGINFSGKQFADKI